MVSGFLDAWAGRSSGLPRQAIERVRRQALRSSHGGKRLRALLLLDTCQAVAASTADADRLERPVLDLACALELFQTSVLVHDDLIDQADLRRGQPSAQVALNEDWSGLTGDMGSNGRRAGSSLALLMGDLLAAAASASADQACESLPHPHACRQTFLAMEGQVDQGQVMDLAMESLPLEDPGSLREAALATIEAKTASYTTVAPLQLGLLAAGREPELSRSLARKLGVGLGVAFQLADDLLDVTEPSAASGKPACGDIREGKRTVLLADALESASDGERSRLCDIYQAPARSQEDVRWAADLFRSSGAIDRASERIATLRAEAGQALSDFNAVLNLDEASGRVLAKACDRFLP
ncbi:hypothetical protein AB656_02780 [Bifidobacterium actinocoloniiforme DSM 22766]|nr:hypothetical protein AB656_02780 [Bifidobacterium actinocoloniiforme DSM 22766]